MKQKTKLKFLIEITNPNLNYFHISLLGTKKTKSLILNLPTWTPGSYMIRDYSTHLHNFNATDNLANQIESNQLSLSSWKIISNRNRFSVNYKIYSFDQSVRTNFLNTTYGFINPASTFLYPENFLDSEIEIEFQLNSYFKYIYTSLPKKKNNIYIANNFNELYDSPFQISNRKSSFFVSKDIQHEIILEGEISNEIRKDLLNDLKKITDFEIDLMKFKPIDKYLFIVHLNENTYGGLEHSKSSVNSFDPIQLHNINEYQKLLGLLTHEYFHLWNIKRIRPIALNPFDYQNPNYTNELWIAEGITSFYDNYILLKTDFYSKDDYLHEVSLDINRLENSIGELTMSLEESSFTAWNKFYKQNPNSHNTGISYYVKGSILVLCMYISILKNTKGIKTFTDILHSLYEIFYLKKNRGFTKKEFFDIAKKITGVDLHSEFNKYLIKPIRIPVTQYLNEIGISRIETSKKKDYGFDVELKSGKYYISKIYKQLPIQNSDININDELIAINGKRYDSQTSDYIKNDIIHDSEIEVLLSRQGNIISRKLKTTTYINHKLIIDKNATEEVKKLRVLFLGEE